VKEGKMTTPGKSNECLHSIRDTRIGRLFLKMEHELFVLEKEAEEAKKRVWSLEYRISELHRILDESILTITDSYRYNQLALKIKPGKWSKDGKSV
jgi:hypothetical protein